MSESVHYGKKWIRDFRSWVNLNKLKTLPCLAYRLRCAQDVVLGAAALTANIWSTTQACRRLTQCNSCWGIQYGVDATHLKPLRSQQLSKTVNESFA